MTNEEFLNLQNARMLMCAVLQRCAETPNYPRLNRALSILAVQFEDVKDPDVKQLAVMCDEIRQELDGLDNEELAKKSREVFDDIVMKMTGNLTIFDARRQIEDCVKRFQTELSTLSSAYVKKYSKDSFIKKIIDDFGLSEIQK